MYRLIWKTVGYDIGMLINWGEVNNTTKYTTKRRKSLKERSANDK